MLPSEKSELWVRRIGYTALILIVLYIIIWLIRFISSNYGKAMEQREIPPEVRAPIVNPQDTQITQNLTVFVG